MSRLRVYRYYLTLRLMRALVGRLRRYTERVAAKISAAPYN